MALAQLAVFVRPPLPGQVKTRLVELIGQDAAVGLYRAFVEDTLDLCERVGSSGQIEVALWSVGPENQTVSRWADRLGTTARCQPAGDLGVRLATALEHGLRRHRRVVVIGSDLPTLPFSLVAAAFDALERAPLVLGPSNDGGYYALGATQAACPSFEGVRWSSRHAMEDTITANSATPVAKIPPWYDVDETEDLALLRAHLSVAPKAAPATAGFLAKLAPDSEIRRHQARRAVPKVLK